MSDKNVKKYLENYAEPEIKALHSLFELNIKEHYFLAKCFYEHVIVIPAYKETDHFIQRFLSSPLAQVRVLMIVVVNQPDNDLDKLPQQVLHKNICQRGETVWQNEMLRLIALDNSLGYIFLIDRFTAPIPQEQGVGLARKLGVDIAVTLSEQGLLRSSWIHSSDADARLPNNYFEVLKREDHNLSVAACYNFHHHSEDADIYQANQQYEKALRYYVAGLHYAGSAYAFFTIGSILTFKIAPYCMVRGFPKRSAGEDFYLLNKIAKLGAVAYFKDAIINIDARTSDRVPFGTGPAVSKILALTQSNHDYCYYHPQLFEFLKTFLTASITLWQYRENLKDWFENLPNEVNVALGELNFGSFVNKQKKASQQQFNKQFIVWFDAFKTLKFIHAIRAQNFDDIALKQAISQAKFTIE